MINRGCCVFAPSSGTHAKPHKPHSVKSRRVADVLISAPPEGQQAGFSGYCLVGFKSPVHTGAGSKQTKSRGLAVTRPQLDGSARPLLKKLSAYGLSTISAMVSAAGHFKYKCSGNLAAVGNSLIPPEIAWGSDIFSRVVREVIQCSPAGSDSYAFSISYGVSWP